jgi:hypothetical protein
MTPVLYLAGESVTPHTSTPFRIAPFVSLLEDVHDYKEVHDVLHTVAVQELPQLEINRAKFPDDPSTRHSYSLHANELRKKQRRLSSVAKRGRCEPTLMIEVVSDFAEALESLDKAVRQRSSDELDAALFAFEALLARALWMVDHRMCELALQRMAEFIAELPLPRASSEPALVELQQLSEQLRQAAELHNKCQSLDRDLKFFQKTRAARPFRSTQLVWRPLLARLSREIEKWPVSEVLNDLRDALQAFEMAVEAGDDNATRDSFELLCRHFGYGFFTIDTDFKQLCATLLQRANSRQQAVP